MAKLGAEISGSKQGIGAFMGEAVTELKKVHFPTRQDTIRSTMGVLLLIVVFAVILGTTDWLIGWVVQTIMGFSGNS